MVGFSHQLLILRSAKSRGDTWLKVQIGKRPNQASGWIDADRVRIMPRNPWRVDVSISKRVAVISKNGRAVRHIIVAVGSDQTPTPRGLFAVYEKVPQPNPEGAYGPFILSLTGHSNVLHSFNGGDGRIALHGQNSNSLGQAVSYGCVRTSNEKIRWLARALPLGTPVLIR